MRKAFSSAVVLICALISTTPAAGETILIRHGGVGFDTGDPPGLVLGGDGFLLRSLFPFVSEFELCAGPPCFPGDVITPSTVFGGESVGFALGSGSVTVGDQTYGSDAGPGALVFRGTLSFDAAPIVIPDAGPSARLISPFVLTGTILGFESSTATTPLFFVDVTGSGLTTLALEQLQGDPSGAYWFLGVRYEILDPVPEPATLLLFGSGAVAALVRARWRRGKAFAAKQ